MGCLWFPASMRAASQCGERFLTAACACTNRIRPRRSRAPFEALVKTRPRPQMKDTMDRTAAVRVLAKAPAWKVPVVAMATPVDPIISAIERDRLAHVAFVTSVNRTNEGKTAQEARDVTQADEDAYEAASGVEENAGMTPFGGQS